jgi:hypothetical protein
MRDPPADRSANVLAFCGCAWEPPQSPVSHGTPTSAGPTIVSETDPPTGAALTSGVSAERPRRSRKLVVSLHPRESQGYHALLALGAKGCDPLFHARDIDDLAAAPDLVPALDAEAEARWQTQPRYPSTRPGKTSRPTLAPSQPPVGAPFEPPTSTTLASRPVETGPGAKSTTG